MTRRFDSRALRQSARGKACTLQIVKVCNGGGETTVLAHAPSEWTGTGMKSPDWWGAFGCSACHDYIDRRTKLDGKHISEDEQRFYFYRGIARTQDYWFREEVIRVG